jgi:hypothetical protein
MPAARTPQDRKPKTAAESEATGVGLDLDFHGATYTIPPTSKWPYRAILALESGRVGGFLAGVLGTEQHDAFVATDPDVDQVTELVAEVQRVAGISGN